MVFDNIKWRLIVAGSLALVSLALMPQLAYPETMFNSVVAKDAIYLQWQQTAGNGQSLILYRGKLGGKLKQLAVITPLTDPDKANAVLKAAPDLLSRGMTFAPDFVQQIKAKPDLDQSLTMASIGYAQVRGVAYLDRDISRRTKYHYRLTKRAADGSEAVIAETDVDSGSLTVPNAPVFHVTLTKDHPQVGITSDTLVRYYIERAEQQSGPWKRETILPLVGRQESEMLTYDDYSALADGRTYYYRVVPSNVFDVNGAVSAIKSIATPDRTPPAAPLLEQAESEPAAAVLNWRVGKEPDLAGYHIYRREVRKEIGEDGRFVVGDEKRLTRTLLAVDMIRFRDGDLIPGRIYQYEMTATDTSGNESAHSPPILARPRDISPPQRPTGLRASIGENGKVRLAWNANEDTDLYAYRIYRGTDESDLTFVRELPVRELSNQASPSHTEQLDTHSEAGYRYAVAAVDATENESPMSAIVSVRLPDIVPPSQPVLTELKAENSAIKLAWAPSPSADVAAYNVYRAEADGKLSRINKAALSANVLTYRDDDVKGGSVYRYAVSAIDHSGNEGAQSDVQSSTTYVAIDPGIPAVLTLDKSSKPWRLMWQGSTKARGFIVYLATARDGDYHQVGSLLTKRSLDVPMTNRSTYWYRIQAVYPGGIVSDLSAPIAITPAAKEKQD